MSGGDDMRGLGVYQFFHDFSYDALFDFKFVREHLEVPPQQLQGPAPPARENPFDLEPGQEVRSESRT